MECKLGGGTKDIRVSKHELIKSAPSTETQMYGASLTCWGASFFTWTLVLLSSMLAGRGGFFFFFLCSVLLFPSILSVSQLRKEIHERTEQKKGQKQPLCVLSSFNGIMSFLLKLNFSSLKVRLAPLWDNDFSFNSCFSSSSGTYFFTWIRFIERQVTKEVLKLSVLFPTTSTFKKLQRNPLLKVKYNGEQDMWKTSTSRFLEWTKKYFPLWNVSWRISGLFHGSDWLHLYL